MPPIPAPLRSRRPCADSARHPEQLSPLELLHCLEGAAGDARNDTAARIGFVVIDLRPRRAFRRSHLPGSHSLPAGLLLSGEWPEGDLLLVDGGDGEAVRVRDALHSAGYRRQILLLDGGIPAWRAACLPLVTQEPRRAVRHWRDWIRSIAAPSSDATGQDGPGSLAGAPLLPLSQRLRRA